MTSNFIFCIINFYNYWCNSTIKSIILHGSSYTLRNICRVCYSLLLLLFLSGYMYVRVESWLPVLDLGGLHTFFWYWSWFVLDLLFYLITIIFCCTYLPYLVILYLTFIFFFTISHFSKISRDNYSFPPQRAIFFIFLN